MARITPQQAAEKLGTRIGQSGTAYMNGVNAVTENPAQKAIAAAPKWVAGIQDAIANGRYERGLSRVTLTGWKNAVATYGQSRYVGSAQKAQANYLTFAQEFFPYLDQVSQTVNAMPANTIEDNIQRMITNVRMLHDFRNR